MHRAAVLALALLVAPGCLVLSLNPAYDDETIAWDPALVGSWVDSDDNVTMAVERGEWKSYRIKYVHPIETAAVTAYLTAIGTTQYLDVTPLSYDGFDDRLRARAARGGLSAVKDQKKKALLLTPTARMRTWLREQVSTGPFGASAVFTRKKPDA